MTIGSVHAVNVSSGGVPKRRVLSAVVGREGLEGDRQADRRHHGGPERAVTLFSLDLIRALQAEGHPIAPGSIGENLTLEGVRWVASPSSPASAADADERAPADPSLRPKVEARTRSIYDAGSRPDSPRSFLSQPIGRGGTSWVSCGASMAVTDDRHIQLLVKQLDEAVPREGHVEVLADPEDFDSRRVRANRLGYLRLGVEILKAAYAPSTRSGQQERVDLDLGYLTGLEDCSYYFERCEDVWSPAFGEPPGALSQIAGGILVLFVVGSLLTGAFTILRWLGSALW